MKVLLGLALVALALLVYTTRQELAAEKKINAELQERLKSANLDLQDKCAKQARLYFNTNGWNREQYSGFSNHYNSRVNKCFIVIEHRPMKPASITVTLTDAYEDKEYGEYYLSISEGMDNEEARAMCHLTLPSGEFKACKSLQQFRQLSDVYMAQ